ALGCTAAAQHPVADAGNLRTLRDRQQQWKIGWASGISTIAQLAAGNAFRSFVCQNVHAYVPQKSSAQRNPPLNKKFRNPAAWCSSKYAAPGSVIINKRTVE